MKVDYYVGRRPTSIKEQIVMNGIFIKWYEVIKGQIDTKIISVTTRSDLIGKAFRRLQYQSGLHLINQRRESSILHIISILVANRTAVRVSKSPLVVSCFDAVPFESNVEELAGSTFSERQLSTYRSLMEKADRIITLSEHARNRISDVCRISLEKFDVVYLSVDHDRFCPQLIENKAETMGEFGFNPDKKNILYVGSESPRKNLERVIRALPLVRKDLDICFVKVGMQLEPYHTNLIKLIGELDLENVVHFCDPIPNDRLPTLYNLADLFVFPSLYEGFGLPPLEAQACGCPVVTSNETSLPEVVGDAAEKVDPYNHESIAVGMLKVLTDEKRRLGLIEQGKIQASKFCWEKTAADTLRVYQKVL